MEIKKDYFYAKSHEWVCFNEDGSATVGITDYAQDMLGDIVFVNLPEVGEGFKAGEGFANIESVKIAADVFAPVSGKVIEINSKLLDKCEMINEDAFDAYIARFSDITEKAELLSADEYEEFVKTEEH